jgi:hypothetical protein
MNDFDSYTLYEIKKRNVYSVRIKVILNAPIRGDMLRDAAEKAFRRFPYYARKVIVSDKGAYELVPCEQAITVTPDDHIVRLGTADTNELLFAVTYEGSSIFFNFAHNFCGGCGAMRWITATLWQYLTELGHDIDTTGIFTAETPMIPEESKEPDICSLPQDLPLGNLDFSSDSFTLMSDYMEFMRNPDGIMGFTPIIIPKAELMKYSRDNDGSPNSIISAVLFRMCTRLFPDQTKFSVRISCNYRSDVGCPQTYRDLVRQIYIPYQISMKDWPIEKISTVTRSRMYIQMQPEVSWNYFRKVYAFRSEIDNQQDLDTKTEYAVNNSPTTHGIPSTCVISYVGNIEWGGLAPYIVGVYSLTFGHVMLEINATEENFCISFQTVHQHERYVDAFLRVLDEEGLSYTVGEFENRKLPEIILPPFA